jgi:hypothetical protein
MVPQKVVLHWEHSMPGTGYFDSDSNAYLTKGTQTWSSYATWTAFTEWAGTASSTLQFTTTVYDLGRVDWVNTLLEINASLPANVNISYGNSLDSAGAIVSATTYAVIPNQNPVSALYGRYFQFEINLSQDSAGDTPPIIFSITPELRTQLNTVTQADIVTSTLSGSVGQRNLTFNVNTGKIVNILTQAHIQNLGDSALDNEVPLILVNKSTTPVVLNIFDADSYGKRKRIDCRLDVQAQFLPLLVADSNGNIRENT